MAEQTWSYARDGATVGPVSHADLCTLFADRQLTLDTQVLPEGSADWVEASTVEDFRGIWGKGFVRPGSTPPPLPADAPPGRPGLIPAVDHPDGLKRNPRPSADGDLGIPQIHPWIRFWARALDNQLLFTAAAFVFVPTTIREVIGWVLATALLGKFIVYPVQLMLFGQTMGKCLFGISVEAEADERPTLVQAVAREWRVMWKAEALGLPLLNIVTMIVAYGRLKREGRTSWDEAGRLVVRHQDVGLLRWVAFVLVWFACYAVTPPPSPKLITDFEQFARSMEGARFDGVRFGAAPSMGSVVVTKTAPKATTQPTGPKKPKAKPKLLTLSSEKAAGKPVIKSDSPAARPVKRPDRPAPSVIFKPDPASEPAPGPS